MTTASDVVVVVPPLSPSDTNPPLGPYLLKACFEQAELRLDVFDLNARYLNRFKHGPSSSGGRVLGDQDKDRAATHTARALFRENCPLTAEPTLHLPDSADPILGMHYSFDSIDRAVTRVCQSGTEWKRFIQDSLFLQYPEPPRVLGLSIMGPQQVFLALIVARLAKQRWPDTPIIAGGSHVTLLADEIAADSRYGSNIDLFMPGHCEVQFVQLVQHVLKTGVLPPGIGIQAGAVDTLSCVKLIAPSVNGRSNIRRATFEYAPNFDRQAFALYDPARVTLPMQLTRGCSYARCTYCTYPAVEPTVDIEPDWYRVVNAITHLVETTGVRRFSFKDSLLTVRNLRMLARTLRGVGLGIEWSATTLLNKGLSDGLLQELYRSGCRTLEFGLETIDPVGQQLFGKPLDVEMRERVIRTTTSAGIAVVINQILGWPGQSLDSAKAQMAWYESLRSQSPELIHASFNMLEVNRRSPMGTDPKKYGVVLRGIAPWAFSYDWNAPAWRSMFELNPVLCI